MVSGAVFVVVTYGNTGFIRRQISSIHQRPLKVSGVDNRDYSKLQMRNK